MARFNGIGNFSGKVGDVVFVKRKKKQFAKAKRSAPINRTEATIKSGSDFGRASTTAARIRKAFGPFVAEYGDELVINKFNSTVMAVFKTIPKAFLGKKEFGSGDVALLNEFQFSSTLKLDSLVNELPIINVLPTGELQLQIIGAIPTKIVKQVPRAINTALQLHVYNMDLDGNNDEIIPINPLRFSFENDFKGATLHIPLNLKGKRLVLVGLGINYSSYIGKINAKRAKAAAIVFAAQFKNGQFISFIAEEKPEPPKEQEPRGLDWNLE